MSAFPGVSSYQSSSLGSKFVVIGVVCCQEMRRNALFHKVLPVLTKYLSGIFHSPRILPSEGRVGVENTGLTGKIAFSPY